MAELPPLIQRFVADVTSYLAGVEEATAATRAFAESATAAGAAVDEAMTAAAASMSRVAASSAEATGANDRVAASYTAVAAAADRAAEQATAAGAKAAGGMDAAIASNERLTTSYAEVGAAADRAAAQAATVGERAAAGTGAAVAANERLTGSYAAEGTAAEGAAAKSGLAGARATEGAALGAAGNARLGESFAGMGVHAETAGTGASRSLGLVAIGAAAVGVATIKMAGDFESAANRLVTSAGEDRRSLDMVKQGMLEIGSQTGFTASAVVDGMYKIESAGHHGADGLQILRAAAQGAKQENADLAHVTDGLTTVMNDYHAKGSDASRMMSQLVQTTASGKVTFDELATSLHSVTPLASRIGLNFGEVGGALAEMTKHGVSADQASQNLGHTIEKLFSPTLAQTKAMEQLGINSQEFSAKVGERGLTGSIDVLVQAITSHMGPAGQVILGTFNESKLAAGNAKQMFDALPPSVQGIAAGFQNGSISLKDFTGDLKKLPPEQANLLTQWSTMEKRAHGFSDALKSGRPDMTTFEAQLKALTGDSTGLRTSLMLTGENAADFNDLVKQINGAVPEADGAVKGWAETQDTFNQKISEAGGGLSALGVTIGTDLLPFVGAAAGAFADASHWMSEHEAAADALAGILAGVFLAAITAVTVAMTKFVVTTLVEAGTALVSSVGSFLAWAGSVTGASAAVDAANSTTAESWEARRAAILAAAETEAAGVTAAAEEEATATTTSQTEQTAATRAGETERAAATRAGQAEVVAAIRTGLAEVVTAIRAGGVEAVAAWRTVGTEEVAVVETTGQEIVLATREAQAQAAVAVRTAGQEVVLAAGQVGTEAGRAEGTLFVESVRLSMAGGEEAAAATVAATGQETVAAAGAVGREAGVAQGTGMAGGLAAESGAVGAAGATMAGGAAVATKAGFLSKFARSAGEVGLVLMGVEAIANVAGVPGPLEMVENLMGEINHYMTGEPLQPSQAAWEAQFGRMSNTVRSAMGLAKLYSDDGMTRLNTSVMQGTQQAVDGATSNLSRLPTRVKPPLDQTVDAARDSIGRIPAVIAPPLNAMVTATVTAGTDMVQAHQRSMDDMHAKSVGGFSALGQAAQAYANGTPPRMTSAEAVMAQKHAEAMDQMHAKSTTTLSAMQDAAGRYAAKMSTTMGPQEAEAATKHAKAMDDMHAKSTGTLTAMQDAAGRYAAKMSHTMGPEDAAAAAKHAAAMDDMHAHTKGSMSQMERDVAGYATQVGHVMTPAESKAATDHQVKMDAMKASSHAGMTAMQQSAADYARRFPESINTGAGAASQRVGQLPGQFQTAVAPMPGQMHTAGTNTMGGLDQGLQGGKPGVMGTIESVAHDIWAKFTSILGIASPSRVFQQGGQDMMTGAQLGVTSGSGPFLAQVTAAGSSATTALVSSLQPAQAQVTQVFQQTWQGAQQATEQGATAIEQDTDQLGDRVTQSLRQLDTQGLQVWREMWQQMEQAGNEGAQRVEDRTGRIPGEIEAQFNRLPGDMRTIGWNAMMGLTNGVDQGGQVAINHAVAVANAVRAQMAAALQVRSPSVVMHELGVFVMQGFDQGIASQESAILARVRTLAANVASSMSGPTAEASAAQELLNRMNSGGQVFEDLTFRGMSSNLGQQNENLMDDWDASGIKDLRTFLQQMSRQRAAAPAASSSAADVARAVTQAQTQAQQKITLVVDPRTNTLPGYGRTPAQVAADQTAAAKGGGDIHVHVAGTVVDAAGLLKLVQTEAQKHGLRNPTTGLVKAR